MPRHERKPLADRLWAKVKKAGPEECWLWTGSIKSNGYGAINEGGYGGKALYVHRVAYIDKNGNIPRGKYVLHRCDMPACCNPAHLFVGTQAENMSDMVAKSRQRNGVKKGAKHGRAKLTNAQVRRIFKSKTEQRALGRRYGVSQTTIWAIKNEKAWTHITKERSYVR